MVRSGEVSVLEPLTPRIDGILGKLGPVWLLLAVLF